MKVLIDMNLSPRWVTWLNQAGFEATHWTSIGANDAPDSAIMAYAYATGQVVLTHDLDFGTILAATKGSKPSVVQIRADDVGPHSIGHQVAAALLLMTAEFEVGALLHGSLALV